MAYVRGAFEVVKGVAYRLLYIWGGGFFRRGFLRRRGCSVKIAPTAFFKYPQHISIGDNSFINHNCCIWAAPNADVTIGSDVLFGPNVCVTASNHGIEIGVPIRMQPGVDASIVIGDDVWLGANVVVTAGVRIGDGCVVGAGAVVTRDLPAYSVCGGVPARVLRSRAAPDVSWSPE